MIFNYIRVSTIEQNTERQLRDVVCDRVYNFFYSNIINLKYGESFVKILLYFLKN